ncbi:hypothetical protein SAMN05421720_10273 [Rhodospira trueperi]|uniref:Uncharacterized protein n=1 Tax=Rhodospira trueperi TaxID=69960 RepID=A0A1G6YQM1_9PROT|nr:hypothetical protein SAMN05421720_10273 [Rhodospira trueperi]
MTASEGWRRGRRVAALAVAVTWALVPTGAAGQGGGAGMPVPLLPPDMRGEPPPQAPDRSAPGPVWTPDQPVGAPPPLGAPREVAPPPGGLTESERLLPGPGAPTTGTPGAPGSWTAVPATPAGHLTPREGGFPADLWTGTRAERVRDLIAALPTTVPSPVVVDLRRRLLLSQQSAPSGLSDAALLKARLSVLSDLGTPSEDLPAPADAAVATDDTFDRARLRALLAEARDDRACALADRVGTAYRAPLWQQVLVWCDLKEGPDPPRQAMLGLALLREMGAGATDDEAFFILAERMAGVNSPPPDSLTGAGAVTYRLLRAQPNVDAPADALRRDHPWTARALALADNGPPAVRAEAAEYAAAVGAISIADLTAAWRGLDVDPRDLETPVSQVVQTNTPLNRALAFRIVSRETDPARRAEGLLHPLETSRALTPALYITHARLYAPLIRELPVEPRVPSFLGAAAGRALFAAGSVEAGRAWLRRLRDQGEAGDVDAADAAALLWPLARMADTALGDPLPTDRLILWRQARAARLGEGAEARRALDQEHVRLLNLLEALGAPVEPVHWLPIRSNRVFIETVSGDDGGGYVDPARLDALDRAAQAGRMGEAVALALLALGPEGPGGASMETLRGVIGALRALDLTAEARRVAVEALLTGG